MRDGMRDNVLLPKVIVRRVLDQVVTLATQPPQQSGFYKPFTHLPETLADGDRARLEADALEQVRTRVQPAFATLRDFLEREYLPALYDQVGWSQTSNGEAGYAYFARLYHDNRPDTAADPRAGAEGGGAHPRRDGARQGRRRASPGRCRSSSSSFERIRGSSTRHPRTCSRATARWPSASTRS